MNESKTYISIRFQNSKELFDTISLLSLPFPLESWENYHCTMNYSQDPFVEIEDSLAGKELILDNPRFMLLGQADKEKRYFVIAFDSVMLENEFNNLKHRYGLIHSHDVFLPHITIAILENESHMKFDVADILVPKLPVMVIESEKSEPLNED
jgi:hypothetical protein